MPIRRHTLALLAIVVAVCLSIGAANPAFFSIANVFDLLKSSVMPGMLAVGLVVVLVSGGIDVSFPAIAAACMYVTCTVALRVAWLDHIALLMGLAAVLGVTLGCANAALIFFFRLPPLIVTLATASVIRGAVLEFVGTRNITNLPSAIIAFSRVSLWNGPTSAGATASLTASLLFLVVAAVVTAAFLKYTIVGRGIYAMGADPSAAERVGFNLRLIHFVVYGLMGGLAGVAGLIHASTIRNANPKDLAGLELTVIAAAVIGGASLTGGRGGVAGTLLGVALLVIVTRSLLLIGVPPEWDAVVLGMLIIVSTTVTAWQSHRRGAESTR